MLLGQPALHRLAVGRGAVARHHRQVAIDPLEALPVRYGQTHLGSRLVASAAPGDVVVIDHGGRTDVSSWGGILSAAAVSAGIAGVVVDGACRDIGESQRFGLPVGDGRWCRSAPAGVSSSWEWMRPSPRPAYRFLPEIS